MHYIIITLLSIFISTYLIYLLTSLLLKIHLKVKPLIFCACCALLINIVLPRIIIGFVGVTETLFILVIITIVFAYVIAYYNESFSKQKELSNLSQQTLLAEQLIDVNQNIVMELPVIIDTKNVMIEAAVVIEANLSDSSEINTTSQTAETLEDVSAEEGTSEIFEIEEIKDLPMMLDTEDAAVEAAAVIETILPDSTEIDTAAQTAEILEDISAGESIGEEFNFEEHNDLDSLLDYAFMQKEQKLFAQALASFRRALSLYPSSEAAPFLVMEIGTILKNQGLYDDAISVFYEAKNLPGLQQNNMFEQEFVKTIAYLRIVKNILFQNKLGFISFNNIPEHVLKEIDAEFREWRKSV